MKRFSAIGVPFFVALSLVGCSSKPTNETNSAPSSNSPATSEPSQNNVPVAEAHSNPGQPPVKTVTPPTQTPRLDGTPPAQPRVPVPNPAGAPPKEGEVVVKDFKMDTPNQAIEIEGVCKLTEDEAICWKPNGDSNDDLAKELTTAIQSKADSYSNSFQFKFKKKNRILVVKTTSKPPKPGSSSNAYANIMNQSGWGSESGEGWTSGSSIFSGASSTGFDQARIERQVFTGYFNKESKTFPLRFQLMTQENRSASISIEVKKGRFVVAGNTYEIVSITDKSPNPYPTYGMNNQKVKFSYVTINPIDVKDPNVVVFLQPADESGQPYGGLDKEGNPITQAAAEKARQEQAQKMTEAAKSGKGYVSEGYQPSSYVQSASIDPMNQRGVSTIRLQFNVEPSKLKKLAIWVQHRTVYVFDKIRLDKN